MAGHASNWFKTGGGTSKGRVFVSNLAIQKTYALGLANGSYTMAGLKKMLQDMAGSPSGGEMVTSLASSSQQPSGQAIKTPAPSKKALSLVDQAEIKNLEEEVAFAQQMVAGQEKHLASPQFKTKKGQASKSYQANLAQLEKHKATLAKWEGKLAQALGGNSPKKAELQAKLANYTTVWIPKDPGDLETWSDSGASAFNRISYMTNLLPENHPLVSEADSLMSFYNKPSGVTGLHSSYNSATIGKALVAWPKFVKDANAVITKLRAALLD